MASPTDLISQGIAPFVGVTDEYLRVWRVILFSMSGMAAVTQAFQQDVAAGGDVASQARQTINSLGGGATDDVSVLTSEVPTGMGEGIETYAAGLRVHFIVNQTSYQTPNTLELTIYNLRDDVAKNLIKVDNYIVLQAGYEWGNAGTIFSGTIKMFKVGHETATDSYLKIYAGDGEPAYNNATNNNTLPKQTQPREQLRTMTEKFQQYQVPEDYIDQAVLTTPALLREHVQYGMTADLVRDFSQQNGATWYILNQKFNYLAPKRYKPGRIIDLNSASGLIGFPEVTPDGINVTCLINSAIEIRGLIQLNNKFINQYFMPGGESGGFSNWPSYGAQQYYWHLSGNQDGIYTPVVINYEGDSRGGPWYMYMQCLSVGQAGDVLSAVFGGLFKMF